MQSEYNFIGDVVYKEGIVGGIESHVPDIVIVRETLPGNANMMSIIYDIRARFQETRIIFLAGNRKPGDAFLSALVSYGVYDILYGENILARDIIGLIEVANTYSNVKHLQPIPLLDEDSNKILFEAPELRKEIKVVEIHKEAGGGFNYTDEEDELLGDEDSHTENEESHDYEEPLIQNTEREKEEITKRSKFKVPQMPQIPRMNLRKDEEDRGVNYQTSSSEKIITFVGGKNGVGASSIAVNFAFMLASEGKKVIYVEFNEKYPSVSYWYELGIIDEGIDTFVNHLKSKSFAKIDDTIVKSYKIKSKESAMQKNYKKFPETLDFLFFSKEYLSGTKAKIDTKDIKDMYLYLIFQLGYDYVILDVPSDISNDATKDALLFSNKIFPIITQDVSSVGYHMFNMNNLNKSGIFIENKTTYILNKYDKRASFTESQISNWINQDDMIVIPLLSSEFIDSDLMGMPLYLRGKSQSFDNSIRKIKKYL